MKYEYKVIPFIGQNKGILSAADVARQLETAINEQIARGWEFQQLSDVNIEVQPGCISGLFGAKVQYVRFDQLIFRAARTSESRSEVAGTPHIDAVALKGDLVPPAPTVARKVRTRPPLPTSQTHLEVWRGKSDDELRAAAGSLNDYTDEARAVIRDELAWREMDPDDDEGSNTSADSFCYHCGADVPPSERECSACGKAL